MKYAPRGADIIRQVRETMAEGQAGPHSRSIDDIAKELEVQVEGLTNSRSAVNEECNETVPEYPKGAAALPVDTANS